MPSLDRRAFLSAGVALGAATGVPALGAARPFFKRHGLPIGIQLYTLGPDAAKDLDGTLSAIAKIGYKSVELAGFLGRTPSEMRAALDRAGLVCTSAHIQGKAAGPDGGLDGDLDKLAAGLKVLGVKTAVMPSLYVPPRFSMNPGEGFGAYLRRMTGELTADDWKMNADFLNAKAAVLKRSGIRVGYHNHNFEFAPVGSTNGYEILLKNTDPALVTFEMDIGWVAAAGADPMTLLAHHKGRFSLAHVKDVKATTKPNFALAMDPTEVGSGSLDWTKLLPAAYAAGVRGFFVEQEPPFTLPRIEAAKASFDYLARVAA